jgi:D-alanyl-D-alanine endopeptidase (penicillin-binding protein 7)
MIDRQGMLLALVGLTSAAMPVHAAHGPARDPHLKSASVLVLDADSRTVLLSRNADQPTPIASITKLMTALVVLDAGQPLDEMIQITAADRDFGRGKMSRLSPGTRLTRGDLMHLALMSSENRAAHALGNNYPGGMTALVRDMNAKAGALGMTSARFVDSNGLSSDNVASPEDLSRLVVAASRNPIIRDYSTDPSYAVRVGRHLVEFRNTDNLVANPGWNILVQKTGYIVEAGKCLVLEAMIQGRAVVIVLLDSLGKYTRVADAKRIKTWMESGGRGVSQVSMR